MAFIPDAPPPKSGFVPDAPPPAAAPTTGVGDIVKGVGDAALSGVSKAATGIVGAPIAMVNRLIAAATGGDGQAAADAAHEYVNRTFGHDTQTPVGKEIGATVSFALAPLAKSGQADTQLLGQLEQRLGLRAGTITNQLSETSDIAGTAGVVAPVLSGVGASSEAATLAKTNMSRAEQLGLGSTEGHAVAPHVAGVGTLPADNQVAAEAALGAEAGVPHGTDVTHGSLNDAATTPGDFLNHAASQVPTAPISDAARARILAARPPQSLLPGNPDLDAYVNKTEKNLLGDNILGDENSPQLTADQVRATRNEATQAANVNKLSDKPENRQLGDYQRAVANAMDQHVADTLPPNSAISPQQIANARQTLAKNYQLRDLIGPGGDVDLQGLAQIHRDNPNLLTGDTRVVAKFAHDHPEVTSGISNADRAAPPGVVQDIMSVNPLKPVKSLAQLFGGWAARGAMRTPLPGLEARTPVAGLGGEFDERPINGLAPPPGAIGEAPGRQTPLPLGEGTGQVSSPPAMPPSPPQTVPPAIARQIARNAPQQGPLSLADELAPRTGQPFIAPAYHGTDVDFPDEHLGGDQHGYTHLAADPETAQGYGSRVIRTGVRFDNPLVIDAKGKNFEEVQQDAIRQAHAGDHDGIVFKNVRDQASVDYGKVDEEPATTTYLSLKDSALGPLADELAPRTYGGQPANADLPSVMSQGVPEDIAAKTAQNPGLKMKVAHSPALIAKNDLGGDVTNEAANRVTSNLAQGVQPISFGQDDLEHVLSPHDIQGADLKPAPNSIVIDKKTGNVLDSGGMAPALVRNLLARWKALHGPLAGAFPGG